MANDREALKPERVEDILAEMQSSPDPEVALKWPPRIYAALERERAAVRLAAGVMSGWCKNSMTHHAECGCQLSAALLRALGEK